MRVPTVHVPYLFGVGLFGLAHAALIFLPPQGVGAAVANFVGVAAWALHFIWLYAIYRDGERRLGDQLPMPAMRVAVVALVACVFFPIWSAFALMVLLRSAVNAVGDGAEGSSPALVRAAHDAPALVVTGIFLVAVSFAIVIQFDVAGDFSQGRSVVRPVEILGTTESYAISVFFLACSGYWLWFVARSIPALYRAMDGMEDRNNDSSPDRSGG